MSVKALAVSCVGAAAALLPEAFFNQLYLQPLDGQQPDGEKYTDHDPVHSSLSCSLVFCFVLTSIYSNFCFCLTSVFCFLLF